MSSGSAEPTRVKTLRERLKATWDRFRANFQRSLKEPLITKPHLEMAEKPARDEGSPGEKT